MKITSVEPILFTARWTEAKNQGDIQDDAIRAELRRCLGLPKQP